MLKVGLYKPPLKRLPQKLELLEEQSRQNVLNFMGRLSPVDRKENGKE